jgi:hypothetical protein
MGKKGWNALAIWMGTSVARESHCASADPIRGMPENASRAIVPVWCFGALG